MSLTIAIAAVIALSALLLSLLAVYQARAMQRASGRHIEAFRLRHEATLDELRTTIESLTSQVSELRSLPSAGPAGLVRSGLNLTKRSQALRMHRRGDSPAEIAATLDLPHQEVELLIKVQKIVLSNL